MKKVIDNFGSKERILGGLINAELTTRPEEPSPTSQSGNQKMDIPTNILNRPTNTSAQESP